MQLQERVCHSFTNNSFIELWPNFFEKTKHEKSVINNLVFFFESILVRLYTLFERLAHIFLGILVASIR